MKLEKHYGSFGGLDTRSNLLDQGSNVARKGSSNFRQNYQNQLQRREGFQHKTEFVSASEAGMFEYKYKDLDSGQSKTQIVGVSYDGNARRLRQDSLQITHLSTSAAAYYSFIYDESLPSWRLNFYDGTKSLLSGVSVTLSMTLSQLVTAINALAISGISALAVDEDGTTISSSIPAYLLDVVYMEEFQATGTDVQKNQVWRWELIPCPDLVATPFQDCFVDNKLQDNPEWQGVTATNLNNSLFITGGTWLYKYDSKSIYRSGMPSMYRFAPITQYGSYVSQTGAPYIGFGLDTVTSYLYRIQPCFIDANGVETRGQISELFYGATTGANVVGHQRTNVIPLGAMISKVAQSNKMFPITGCQVSGQQTQNGASATLTIKATHNLRVGQYLRIPVQNTVSSSLSSILVKAWYYGLITAVSSTSVTFNWVNQTIFDGKSGNSVGVFADLLVLNSCYGPDIISGQIVPVVYLEAVNNGGMSPFPAYGAFFKIYRTTKLDLSSYDLTKPNTFDFPSYELEDVAIPVYDYSDANYAAYTYVDSYNDITQSTNYFRLSRTLFTPDESSDALPRACAIISQWQGQLIQGGRTLLSESIVNQIIYPMLWQALLDLGGGQGPQQPTPRDYDGLYSQRLYQENDLCDFQSVFWADVNNSEAFPQSGLNEQSFENSFNDQVMGMGQNKDGLFVFKNRSMALMTGALALGNINTEFLETDSGCGAHNSIVECRGALIFMDENLGFWSCVAGTLPEFIGYAILDYFKDNNQEPRSDFLNFRRAQATVFRPQDQYLCYIPAGKKQSGETGSYPDPTAASMLFVFDYGLAGAKARAAWYPWKNLNAAAGIIGTADGILIFSERTTTGSRVWKQKFTGSKYDFSDHQSATEWYYKAGFFTADLPVVDKHTLRNFISSIQGGFNLRVDQFANFIDRVIGTMTIPFPSLTADKLTVKQETKAASPKLSGISFGFYNNDINVDLRIDGWEMQYDLEYDPNEPRK